MRYSFMKEAMHSYGIIRLLTTIGIVFYIGIGYTLKGQNDPITGNWLETKSLYNSATIGDTSAINITALYRQQWIGVEGAPKNILLVAHSPFSFAELNHGIGVTLIGQQKGLFTNVEALAQYAFKYNLLGGTISAGIELGFINSSFDGSKAFIPDDEGLTPNDPAIPNTTVSGRGFDMGAGLYYTHSKFFMGMAVKHLFTPKVQYDTNHFLLFDRTYNAMAVYNFGRTESLLSWHPSVIAVTDLKAWRIDLGITMGIASKYFARIMYRPNSAAGFGVKAIWGKVSLCYAFEMPISVLARGNYGTHELTVSYALPKTKKKDKGLIKKSIRLL